jgi:hypothetical protein
MNANTESTDCMAIMETLTETKAESAPSVHIVGIPSPRRVCLACTRSIQHLLSIAKSCSLITRNFLFTATRSLRKNAFRRSRNS